MKTNRLNEWFQIAAAIGVIVGLVLVAYELRISNRLGYEQAEAASIDNFRFISEITLSANAAELFVRAYEGDQLTRVEAVKFNELMNSYLGALYYEWVVTNTGTLEYPGGFGAFYQRTIQYYFGSDAGRRQWDIERVAWIPAFASEIDKALAAPNQRGEGGVIGEIDYVRGVADQF